MASYLLYFPGVKVGAARAVREAGLQLDCGGLEERQCLSHGPDGGSGLVCWWVRPGRPGCNPFPGVALSQQDWTERAEGYWIGSHCDQPVAPEDLMVRESCHQGRSIELGDQKLWIVPQIDQLPQRPRFVHGRVTSEIEAEYRPMFEQARALAGQVLGLAKTIAEASEPSDSADAVLTVHDAWRFATDVLRLNYRLCAEVIDYLGLFDSQDRVAQVCLAAIGPLADFLEVQKPTVGQESS